MGWPAKNVGHGALARGGARQQGSGEIFWGCCGGGRQSRWCSRHSGPAVGEPPPFQLAIGPAASAPRRTGQPRRRAGRLQSWWLCLCKVKDNAPTSRGKPQEAHLSDGRTAPAARPGHPERGPRAVAVPRPGGTPRSTRDELHPDQPVLRSREAPAHQQPHGQRSTPAEQPARNVPRSTTRCHQNSARDHLGRSLSLSTALSPSCARPSRRQLPGGRRFPATRWRRRHWLGFSHLTGHQRWELQAASTPCQTSRETRRGRVHVWWGSDPVRAGGEASSDRPLFSFFPVLLVFTVGTPLSQQHRYTVYSTSVQYLQFIHAQCTDRPARRSNPANAGTVGGGVGGHARRSGRARSTAVGCHWQRRWGAE